ncbi:MULTISPECIES: helix-turn-helix domain-containing protein [Enterococcus]|uniref:Helix-turn-helix domain-containing protein n=1 Tax=Enterococcus alishanensis TaxID=1303817 RepID=A0ABS6T9X9_9ENTE|nr:helix-turn-helix domain-containing protein [Enterococcus alishanensis]MBV7389699.1 helix-turn-helix domain-containing protein [Enterococcus alishanensis]
MDLTKRQLELLVYLANINTWLTSEKLAEHIHTNKKTVQSEIKNMLELYPDDIEIESNKRNGYHLLFLAPELQTQIVAEVKKHKMYSSMNFRASTIIIYLIFQEDYVSMQHLADLFFLSKTAISNEIKTIQRWIERNVHLDLEISSHKGLKIHSSENMRRIFASMVGTESVLIESKLPEAFIMEVLEKISVIQNFMQTALIEANYIVSGEDFLRYARYVSLTVVRGKNQKKLELLEQNDLLVSVIDKLTLFLDKTFDYSLDDNEQTALGNRLLELNYLHLNEGDNLVLKQKLRKFETALIDYLKLPTEQLFKNPDALLVHIQQMATRMAAGHNVLNHFAQKTLSNYPLETYLVRRFFPLYFDLRPNLAELSYLVLYLAEALENYRSEGNLLIVSNQPLSILNALKRSIENSLQRKIRQVQIEPVYVFEAKKEQHDYSVLLTTEQEIVFENPGFSFIPSVLSEAELNELSTELYHVISEREEINKKNFLSKYYGAESQVDITKKIDNIHQLLPNSSELVLVPITSKILFACEIKESGMSQIREYHLKEPIIYQQRKISTLIHISYVKNPKILADFSAISEILTTK